MQQSLIEIVPLIVLLAGVIGAIYSYRQAERQNKPGNAPSLAAIGNTLANEGLLKIQIEETQHLIKAVNRLADAQIETTHAMKENANRWKDQLDEMVHIRRAHQDIVNILRNDRK